MNMDNLMLALDIWMDALTKMFKLEKKLEITEGIIIQIYLARQDLEGNQDGNYIEFLEINETFLNLIKKWTQIKIKPTTDCKSDERNY